VIDLVSSLGYPVERVSQDEYKRRIDERRLHFRGAEYRSATTKAFRWWLNREPFDFTRSAITDCSFTVELLGKAGIVCPALDEKLIKTYINAGVRDGYFIPPSPVQSPKGSPFSLEFSGEFSGDFSAGSSGDRSSDRSGRACL
jgi:hypothetical protein